MVFKITYGLGSSFGMEEMEIECDSPIEAEEIAYDKAIEEYETYEGMYGLRTVEDVMEEEGLSEEEAYDTYIDERESWLDYSVERIG